MIIPICASHNVHNSSELWFFLPAVAGLHNDCSCDSICWCLHTLTSLLSLQAGYCMLISPEYFFHAEKRRNTGRKGGMLRNDMSTTVPIDELSPLSVPMYK